VLACWACYVQASLRHGCRRADSGARWNRKPSMTAGSKLYINQIIIYYIVTFLDWYFVRGRVPLIVWKDPLSISRAWLIFTPCGCKWLAPSLVAAWLVAQVVIHNPISDWSVCAMISVVWQVIHCIEQTQCWAVDANRCHEYDYPIN